MGLFIVCFVIALLFFCFIGYTKNFEPEIRKQLAKTNRTLISIRSPDKNDWNNNPFDRINFSPLVIKGQQTLYHILVIQKGASQEENWVKIDSLAGFVLLMEFKKSPNIYNLNKRK